MDRLEQMRVFAAVAREGGLAAAARQLGKSAASVTRAVGALEQRLGTTLLVRTTHHVRLTDVGESYLKDCRRILAEIQAAEKSAAEAHLAPQGRLSVTAPVLFGERFVLPLVREYLEHHPRVRVRMKLTDKIVNLVDAGIDVAFRIGELPDSGLIANPLCSVRQVVVAAPGYLEQNGIPQKPADLASHSIVLPESASTQSVWRFHNGDDAISIRLQPVLRVNSNTAAIEAAQAGLGLTRVMSYQVQDRLAEGLLRPLLQDYEEPAKPISILRPAGLHASAKLREFVALAVASLRIDE